MQSLLKKALFAGALSLALAACNSVNLDNGSIGGGGTTPNTAKDPNITSVSINGNQLIGQNNPVWISSDADVLVRVTSNVGLKSLTYDIQGQSGSVSNPKATNQFRVSNLSAGTTELTIIAKNKQDAEHKLALPIKVDVTAPKVSVLSPVEAGSGTIPKVSGVVTLKAGVSDGESGVRAVRFYQKGETSKEITDVSRLNGEYTTQIDTTQLTDGVKYFEIQAINNAGLTTSSIVGINVVNTTEPPEPTAPVVRLLLAPGEKTGTITIPFIVSSEDDVKVAKLLVNSELYKAVNAPLANTETTFTLDVSLLPLGTHTVTVVAETVKGKSATSNSVTIQVTKNLSLPLFKISSPRAGASLGGKMPIEISVVKKGSNFKFTSDITVQVIGFGGTVIKTLTIPHDPSMDNADGIYLTESVDWPRLTGADTYDIRAFTTMAVDEGTPAADPVFNVTDQLTTGVSISNQKPPAANIIIPSRNDAASQVSSAVITRNSGIFLQVTDDDILDPNVKYRVDVRLVSKNPAGGTKITKYLLNLPLQSGTFFFAIPELILDGSEYVEEGDYVLQTISEDNEGNGNVQEANITVKRSGGNVAGLRQDSNIASIIVNNPYKAGDMTKYSATWELCKNPDIVEPVNYFIDKPPAAIDTKCVRANFTNPTTISTFVLRNGTQLVDRNLKFAFTGTLGAYTYSFSTVGNYKLYFMVQDLITGVVQVFPGDTVGVTAYQ